MTDLDWDSIREAEGFHVGDPVRARGQAVGFIRHLIRVEDRYRAHIHWPTVPFESEYHTSSSGRGSEQFVDLAKLTKVLERSGEQLVLI